MTFTWKSTNALADKIYPATGITAWSISEAHRALLILRESMPKPDSVGVAAEISDVHLQNAWTWLVKHQASLVGVDRDNLIVSNFKTFKPFSIMFDFLYAAVSWFIGCSEPQLFHHLCVSVQPGDLKDQISSRVEAHVNKLLKFLTDLHGVLPTGDFFDSRIERTAMHLRLAVLKLALKEPRLMQFDHKLVIRFVTLADGQELNPLNVFLALKIHNERAKLVAPVVSEVDLLESLEPLVLSVNSLSLLKACDALLQSNLLSVLLLNVLVTRALKNPNVFGFSALKKVAALFEHTDLELSGEEEVTTLLRDILSYDLSNEDFLKRVAWVDQQRRVLIAYFSKGKATVAQARDALKLTGLTDHFFLLMIIKGPSLECLAYWFESLKIRYEEYYNLPSVSYPVDIWMGSLFVLAEVATVAFSILPSYKMPDKSELALAKRLMASDRPTSELKKHLADKADKVGAKGQVLEDLRESHAVAVDELVRRIRPADSGIWRMYLKAQGQLQAFKVVCECFVRTKYWAHFCSFMFAIPSQERASELLLAISWLSPARFLAIDLIQEDSFLMQAEDPRVAALNVVFGTVISELDSDGLAVVFELAQPCGIDTSRVLIEEFLAERFSLQKAKFFKKAGCLPSMNQDVFKRRAAFDLFSFVEIFRSPDLHPLAVCLRRNVRLFAMCASYLAGPAVLTFDLKKLSAALGKLADACLETRPLRLPFLEHEGGAPVAACAGAGAASNS